MPDPDSTPLREAVTRRQEYPIKATPATPSLRRILATKIATEGPIRFTDFMAVALYHPELGYYARETRQVGRGGDFFTSVSVGPLFGNLLARRFLSEWQELGSPARWRIIECGAHDGTLAADVLDALQQLNAVAFAAVEYAICEPLPRLRSAQRATLQPFSGKVVLIDELGSLAAFPLPGIVFGNELLDALPFHLLEWCSGRWHECRVGCDSEGGFFWNTDNPVVDPLLIEAVDVLGENFPEGYRTEVRTNIRSFLEPLTRCISTGLLLWPDYGFARPDYYLPERHRGTLRTFSSHRAAEDPLATPGEIDITAHVDFTAVAESAIALGCQVRAFRNQGAWLTEIGREWLLSLEGRPQVDLLRQFQTLTHPAHLGGSFHILELAWKNPSAPALPATDLHRLALHACPPPLSQ
ncbi:MAG: SAM-dependent methyltransferase [Luteolibacter sp.]